MSKPFTDKSRIYRGYLNEKEYKWVLASNLEKTKDKFKLEYPDVEFVKIKLRK